MYKLRDYQEDSVKAGLFILKNIGIRKEIVVLPTAGGKSIVIAKISQEIEDTLIVLQPSKELLAQNYQKFIDVGGVASIYSASAGKKEIGKTTFATIGSIIKEIPFLKSIKNIKIIIDECHIAVKSGSQVRKLIRDLKVRNVLGLTATPFLLNPKGMGAELQMLPRVKQKLFSDICYTYQIKDMVDNNYWTNLQYKVVNQNTEFLKANTNGSDYTEKSIIKYYEGNDLTSQIVDMNSKCILHGKKAVLIFVPTINAAEELVKKIPGSATVNSKTPAKERDKIVLDFKLGVVKTVINVGVFTTGFDYPELDAIIVARSTMSFALYYQIIGRGVRIFEGKKNTLIIDLSENFSRFGRIESYTIENIPDYGWALMRGNDLISGYPIDSKNRPQRKNLGKKYKPVSNIKMPFGKYENQFLADIYQKDMHYLVWVYDNVSFFQKQQHIKIEIANLLNIA